MRPRGFPHPNGGCTRNLSQAASQTWGCQLSSRLLFFVFAVTVSSGVTAADILCEDAGFQAVAPTTNASAPASTNAVPGGSSLISSLAHAQPKSDVAGLTIGSSLGAPRPTAGNSVGLLSASSLPRMVFLKDPTTRLSIGVLARKPQTDRQVDPTDAPAKTEVSLDRVSPAERLRLANSASCSGAFQELSKVFERNRRKLTIPTHYALGDFVDWFYSPGTSDALRVSAAPIVLAQSNFERECLEASVPPEMEPDSIQRAVGLLMFEDKVICTALRVSYTEVVTAQHCFLSIKTGERTDYAVAAALGKGRYWFSYPAEANDRFSVCRDSIPSDLVKTVYAPANDVARLKIATTRTSIPKIVLAKTPVPAGSSLYLRGFFPFTHPDEPPLSRLRATKAGGCFAHGSADKCFFHTCQTTPMMSGAPVFLRPDAAGPGEPLVLAGMHLGSADLSNPDGATGAVCEGANGARWKVSNFGYQFN